MSNLLLAAYIFNQIIIIILTWGLLNIQHLPWQTAIYMLCIVQKLVCHFSSLSIYCLGCKIICRQADRFASDTKYSKWTKTANLLDFAHQNAPANKCCSSVEPIKKQSNYNNIGYTSRTHQYFFDKSHKTKLTVAE